MTTRFYSNGKLLITGEYAVLDGAKAFALPTKMGQDLVLYETEQNNQIHWKSYDFDQSVWLEVLFNISEITQNNYSKTKDDVTNVLKKILYEAHLLNPNILPNKGFLVETHLTFPRNWGLGTSSTLLNNVAQWFKIDAFDLLKNSFGGSGYDIANAQHKTPILYQLTNGKPNIEPVKFNPNFTTNCYFLYLNRKQNSKTAIANYYSKKIDYNTITTEIDAITAEIVTVQDQQKFESLLQKHESILSTVLDMQTVKERYFSDFVGTIKSLGAWGGDFVLVVSNTNPKSYFESKGFSTLIPYREMIA